MSRGGKCKYEDLSDSITHLGRVKKETPCHEAWLKQAVFYKQGKRKEDEKD